MSETRSYGLQQWLMADAPAGGTMAADADLEAVAETVKGSASLVTDDPTITDFYVEEEDDPVESIYQKGNTNLKLSVYDMTPATAVLLLGGTVDATGDAPVWQAPRTLPIMEKSIRLITRKGLQIDLPRVKFFGKINHTYSSTGLLQIDISARVLVPGNVATAPISWSQPA